MAYQIFISFKNEWQGRPTRDRMIAQTLYNELKKYGVEVFFSNEELMRRGRPDYGRLIDDALDSSKVLLLVGTNAEFVKSRWVEYEWELFNNEINSGRKDGKIITVLEGMDIGQLPIGLRRWQSFGASEKDIFAAAQMSVNALSALTGDIYKKQGSAAPSAESLYQLGMDYLYGNHGNAKDPEKAAVYLRQSADAGFAFAQTELANLLVSGKIRKIDEQEAIAYLRLAAEQGHSAAQYNLGARYEFADGVELDFDQARYWYSLAAAQGVEGAKDALAELGTHYDLYPDDIFDAQELAFTACCYFMGNCGKPQDYEKAYICWEKAANLGNSDAQHNVGMCLLNGWGTEKNRDKAKQWLSKAAQNGSKDAEKELCKLS